MKPKEKNRKVRVYIPLIAVIVIVLGGAWYWYNDYSKYITTDDAHVDADNVNISAKLMGRVYRILKEEGDTVQEGELIAVLDSTDLYAQRIQAQAQKNQAVANLDQTKSRYESDRKSIRIQEINLERAKEDLDRAEKQSQGGVISSEQMSHVRKAYETAAAQLDASKTQLNVSRSSISTASAAIETSDAQIKVLDTQLKNTRLFAPSSGVVSKKWVMPGDIVQPGQSVFTITISKNLWVLAFLEETRISEIHNGQSVKFTIDAYPNLKFNGKVFLIGSTTASVFSLIPANNASGNFTKVTQRVPVRISIDSTENNTDISSLKILSGMSVEVKIIKG